MKNTFGEEVEIPNADVEKALASGYVHTTHDNKLGFGLRSPLKPDFSKVLQVNQEFGKNDVDFYAKLNLKGHNGIDFYTLHYERGEAPVFAAHDGFVTSDATRQSDTAGRYVWLESEEVTIDGRKCKVRTVYFHLKKATVSISDRLDFNVDKYNQKERPGSYFIKAGQQIGISDNTGQYTTGPHLHFGMYILWKQESGAYQKDFTNGFDGAVNPMPFFNDGQIMQHLMGFRDSKFWKNGKEFARKDLEAMLGPDNIAEINQYRLSFLAAKKFLADLLTAFQRSLTKLTN